MIHIPSIFICEVVRGTEIKEIFCFLLIQTELSKVSDYILSNIEVEWDYKKIQEQSENIDGYYVHKQGQILFLEMGLTQPGGNSL